MKDFNPTASARLHQAIAPEKLDTTAARAAILEGADPNLRDQAGHPALMRAIAADDRGLAVLLLDQGADPNTGDGQGRIPMDLAIPHRRHIVPPLLAHGADPDAVRAGGCTALMRATRHNQTDTMRVLIAAGARVDIRNEEGWSALTYAVRFAHLAAARLLLDQGADTEVRAAHDVTLLMSAAIVGNLEIMRLLLDRGARLEARNKDGWTALMLAGTAAAAGLLAARGADVTATLPDGRDVGVLFEGLGEAGRLAAIDDALATMSDADRRAHVVSSLSPERRLRLLPNTCVVHAAETRADRRRP